MSVSSIDFPHCPLQAVVVRHMVVCLCQFLRFDRTNRCLPDWGCDFDLVATFSRLKLFFFGGFFFLSKISSCSVYKEAERLSHIVHSMAKYFIKSISNAQDTN